jgi:signal transduction histidine kinase/CheY-like chemotaxis protein
MHRSDIERIDRITRVIHQILHGELPEKIAIEDQEKDEIRQLSEYVNRLAADLKSTTQFAHDLSFGRLSTESNCRLALCGRLKHLQASLKHLTWQTGQVAKGDLTQHVSFMGEFSTSFNWMVRRIAEHQKELQKEVSERKEAQRLAEDSNKAKSTFLANMSHKIRTPMNGVLGMAELLLHTELSTRQRHLAETILKSGKALLSVLNDILDVSKIEAGRLELQNVDFDLCETIEDSVSLFAGHAHDKRLELICEVDDDLPDRLTGDPARLRQILNNLIHNAIKFTETGEIRIRAFSLEQEEDRARIGFELKDTGVGIPLDAQAKIFDSFYQVDGSANRKYGGTGLGLSICKQLCEMMGGAIELESQPGRGSTFRFCLSLKKQPGRKPDAFFDRGALKGLRVLTVDDNETCRVALDRRITSWGMHIDSAANGTEALRMIREAAEEGNPFDVALIDEMMPEMSGLELACIIKSDPFISGVHLLMLTGSGRIANSEGADGAEGVTCLGKPVRRSELRDAFLAMFGRKARADIMNVRQAMNGVPAGFRVLLAEDDPVNKLLAEAFLQALGIDADFASTGLQVLETLERKSYDLILMACQMPDMDGYEAARRIRANERQASGADFAGPSSHIPIVALTGQAMAGDRERCLEAGMDDCLTKPISLPQLDSVLQRQFPNLFGHPRESSAA